jgi:hypothetical protein
LGEIFAIKIQTGAYKVTRYKWLAKIKSIFGYHLIIVAEKPK